MSNMTMIKRKFSVHRQTSYEVSPKETKKSKPRRVSLSKQILTSFNISSSKKISRSLSSNTLKIVDVTKDNDKLTADINKSHSKDRCKKGKNKQYKSGKELERHSPRRSSVPISCRHRVSELKYSETPTANMRRRSLNNVLSALKTNNKPRKGSAGSAIEFWKIRSQQRCSEAESGISSASSTDSITGKKTTYSSSGSDDASKEFSWSDSVLTPTSEEDDFKIYGEHIITQDSDDDVFREEPRRKSIDFNLILKSFSKRKTAFRSRSQTQGEIKVRPAARRNTYDFESSPCAKEFITPDARKFKMNKTERRRPSFDHEKPSEALKHLLQSTKNTQAFRSFLQNEYSEENLDFWLDCQRYLTTPKKEKVATKIFETYLKTNAPREVNLDAKTKAETAALMETPNKSTFTTAQNQIFRLMLNDSFRRFSSSNEDWLP